MKTEKPGKLKECKNCVYWESPEFDLPKDCQFPWFDYTEEDIALRECQEEVEDEQSTKM